MSASAKQPRRPVALPIHYTPPHMMGVVMDLTSSYPRSAKDTIAGVAMIARTTDKAKA